MEKVLWPTQELKDKFKKVTGKDLNVAQLLQNVRFRDAWMSTMSRQPEKSERLRVQLRRQAEDTVRPRKPRDPRSEYPKKGTKRGDKRKNRSFSTERDGEGRTATPNPGDKRPKTSSTPEAQRTVEPQASGSSQSATAPPPLGEDAVKEVIEGEEEEPGCLNLSELHAAISSEGGDDDDVDAAKKRKINPSEYKPTEKDKKMHEHILWVHKGQNERLTLTKTEWNIFQSRLQDEVVKLVLANQPFPKIDWQRRIRGVGVLTPMDEQSQVITKEIVGRIKVAESTFRAWAKGDKDKYTNLTLKLPNTMHSISGGKALQVLSLMNDLPQDKSVLRGCKPVVPGSKERILRIGVEDEVFDKIKALDGRVLLGACCINVFHLNVRVRKEST